MIPAAIKKLLARDEADLAAEIEELRQQQREYQQGLGPHIVDAHARVDQLVEESRAAFAAPFQDMRGLPDGHRHPFANALAVAFVLGSEGFAEAAHAAVDATGSYDTTPGETIAAELAKFQREISSRQLAIQRRDQASRAEAERRALDDFDRRAEQMLAD